MRSYPLPATGLARRARPARWGWAVAALLALALGLAAGRLLPPPAPGEGSPEVEFARDMTAHHAQAVEMAVLALGRTQDRRLRALALDITLTQQAQVGQMGAWLAGWGRPFAGPEAPMKGMGEAMGMASRREVNALATLPTREAEASFLRLMVRHHRGGVAMAEAALAQSRRPEVRRLAEAVVAGQRAEVEAMTAMLEERGVAPPAPVDQSMPGMDHSNGGGAR